MNMFVKSTVAVAVVPAAGAPSSDPTYALMDTYLRLHEALCAAIDVDEDNVDAEQDAEIAAAIALVSTPPQTLAGTAALLRFVAQRDEEGDDMLMNYLDRETRETCHGVFFAAISTAVERHVRAA